MGQYSKQLQGEFTSANVAKFIQLPCLPRSFKMVNKTQFDSATQDKVKEAFSYKDEAALTAYVDYNASSSKVVSKAKLTAGGFTWIEAGEPTFGAAVTGTAVSKANPAVVTMTSHGLQSGDAAWLTGTTAMLQVAGVPYTVTRIDANSFSIPVDSSGFADAATAVTAKKFLYPDLYVPFLCFPTNISKASQAVVTTNVDHSFVVGSQVKFRVPDEWGMVEMDGLEGTVVSVAAGSITVDVDSSAFTAFAYPSSAVAGAAIDFPQVYAIGDENFGYVFNGGSPLNRVLGAFFANTRQGVLVGVGNGTQVMHTTSDVIHWEAELPDLYQV